MSLNNDSVRTLWSCKNSDNRGSIDTVKQLLTNKIGFTDIDSNGFKEIIDTMINVVSNQTIVMQYIYKKVGDTFLISDSVAISLPANDVDTANGLPNSQDYD